MTGLSPLRQGRITASRVSAILELNKYQSRADTLREMVRQHFGAESEFKGNLATEHGNAHEGDGLTLYERENATLVYGGQLIAIHPTIPWLAATPDGLVGPVGMVEVKAPWRAVYSTIQERPDYEAQIRLQLECTGREWCDFVVYRDADITVSRVDHNPAWLPSVLPVLEAFMAEYEAVVASEELSAPFLAPKVKRTRKAAAA